MKKLISKTIILCLLLNLKVVGYSLKPLKEYRIKPNQLGLIYKELNIITSDSLMLKAWFFPAQDTISNEMFLSYYNNPRDRKYVAKQNVPTIIICNGDWGNMSYITNYAYEITTKGFNVVLFDWRGFGESDDWDIDEDFLCYSEFLTDYNAVIDYVLKMEEVNPNKMGLFGFSTGAYLSFAIAAMRNDIKAVVTRGLITSFDDVIPILNKISPQKKIKIPNNYPQELLPINCAKYIKSNVLLVVGQKDNRTPVIMSEKIFQLLEGKKKLIIVPGAGHGGKNAPEWVMKDFFKELKIFYNNAFI